MKTNPCQLTTRSSFVTTDSSRRLQFPMLITWVTTESSSGSDDNVVMKISHGIVVKMTNKIFTVYCYAYAYAFLSPCTFTLLFALALPYFSTGDFPVLFSY